MSKSPRRFLNLIYTAVAAILLSPVTSNVSNAASGLSNIPWFQNEKPLVVVIPSYKNREWYQNNLNSVFSQKYHNFRVIYVDDASPDGTGELVSEYIKEKGQQFRVTLIQNSERVGALANIYKAIWQCAPHEIVVNLDGDDWFYDSTALATVNQTYADPDVWMTYGRFIYYPSGDVRVPQEVPGEVIEQNTFRNFSWGTTALRTFYAGLFHKIKKEDLLYNGNFFPCAWDLALMWPILEMSGTHSRPIHDVLYVYNIANAINDFKVDYGLQAELDRATRNMPKYAPIEKPYD